MNRIMPWHQSLWGRLQEGRRRGQLTHAMLLRGRAGFGKRQFADAFVARLLCEGQEDFACGHCRGCALMAAASHPDLCKVFPEEPGKAIRVDEIRGLIQYFALRSHYGGFKVALISPADVMNRAAANALLKLLEEPPAGGIIILLADRAERLPATIRSRCQQFPMDRASGEELLAWDGLGGEVAQRAEAIARAGGSPLAAQSYADPTLATVVASLSQTMAAVLDGRTSPLAAATQYAKSELLLVIDQLLRLAHELLLLQQKAPLPLEKAGRRPAAGLQSLADQLDSVRIATFIQQLLATKQLRLSSPSLREVDLGESVWFDLKAMVG